MRRALAVLLTSVVATSASGCSLLSDDRDGPGQPAAGTPEASPGVIITEAPPNAVDGIRAVLQRRARAVLDGDRARFLAGLVGDDALQADQATYFDNLQQLPLATFSYELQPAAMVREGDDYWAEVDLSLQLDGFDERPVVTRDRFRFTPGKQPGHFRLATVDDLRWEAEHQVQHQPWDDEAVVVRREGGVLGIFDEQSVRAAGPLMRSVSRGIADVAGVVPSSWSQTAVVYAPADTDFLATVPGLPGGDATSLDAVAFPVFAAPDGTDLVSTRFVLHPRMLEQRGRARDRLVRHELTHVAIGERDDFAPVWLSEGLAEYVSVQPLPPEKRTISQAAIDAARAGITEMPADDSFNDAGTPGRASANYGIAWFACQWLADGYGEVTLWQVLDALDEPDVDPDQVLMDMLGLNVRTLARKAGKLILATYDAPPPPDPVPSATPSGTSSATPSGEPSESPTGDAR